MSNTDYSNLRVAVVGAGLMGRWHARYASRLGVKLVSVVDSDAALAAKLAREIDSSTKSYTDMAEMFSSTQPDVVHICTPLESHFPISQHAIDAGVHVIVEKPLAMTVAETQTLLQAADVKNVKLCPVHQFGFQSGVLKTMAALESLGELLHVRFTTGSAGGEGGSGAELDAIIADIIPHPLSVLQRLRPGVNLDASQWSGVHTRHGELQVNGKADGVAIDIYISMNARPTRCEMELFCSQGKVSLNLFHGYAVIEKGNVSRMQKMIQPLRYALNELFVAGTNLAKRSVNREPAYPGLTRLLDEFYQSITTATACPISPAEILAVAAAREELTSRLLVN
jgi:predicted dehydrogenase